MDSYKKDFRNLVNHNLLLIFSLPIIFNSLLNFFQKLDLTFIDKISFTNLSDNPFTLEKKRIKIKKLYWLLEGSRAFNKTESLVISSMYM